MSHCLGVNVMKSATVIDSLTFRLGWRVLGRIGGGGGAKQRDGPVRPDSQWQPEKHAKIVNKEGKIV